MDGIPPPSRDLQEPLPGNPVQCHRGTRLCFQGCGIAISTQLERRCLGSGKARATIVIVSKSLDVQRLATRIVSVRRELDTRITATFMARTCDIPDGVDHHVLP